MCINSGLRKVYTSVEYNIMTEQSSQNFHLSFKRFIMANELLRLTKETQYNHLYLNLGPIDSILHTMAVLIEVTVLLEYLDLQ